MTDVYLQDTRSHFYPPVFECPVGSVSLVKLTCVENLEDTKDTNPTTKCSNLIVWLIPRLQLQQRVRNVPGDPEVIHWNARAATVRCFVASVNEKPWLRDPLAGLKNFRGALNDFQPGDREGVSIVRLCTEEVGSLSMPSPLSSFPIRLSPRFRIVRQETWERLSTSGYSRFKFRKC